MTLWKSEPDPTNPGQWRIVNAKTGKTIVYGLSERDANDLVEQRNRKEAKREKQKA
jgi:hypothetical protein